MWAMVWIMISDIFCLFDITWFSKAAKCTKKTGLSHSTVCYFLVDDMGVGGLTKSDKVEHGRGRG